MSTNRCDDIKELHPYVRELAEKLITECKKQGINVKIIDTFRSKERQDYLYGQGRKNVPYARPGNIVTNAKGSDMSSYHNWRLAFDVIHNKSGDEYNTSVLNKVGPIGEKLGLEWGGRWTKMTDRPHFQYTFGLSINALNGGAKVPARPDAPAKKTYTVTPSETKINVDGEILTAETVMINNNNYIRMRGIDGKALKVDFINGMPTIIIRNK